MCGHVASVLIVFAMCCNVVDVTVVFDVLHAVVIGPIAIDRCGYNRACCRLGVCHC